MKALRPMVQISKRILGVKDRPKLRDWPTTFDSEQPQFIALVGLSRGGSHFVIDQFHKHPNFLGLNEGVPTYRKIKRFFIDGDFNLSDLEEGQLLPQKDLSAQIKYLITNKLDLEQTVYYQPVLGSRLTHMYCLRNPFGTYLSWCKGWEDFAKRNCDSAIDQTWIDQWYESSLISSLVRYAMFWDEKKDLAVNLEVLAVHKNEGLDPILKKLEVPLCRQVEFVELTNCPTCGEKLAPRESNPGKANQVKALYCPKCDSFILGPGGYNYIRKTDPSQLASWKTNPKTMRLIESYTEFLGRGMVDYFYDEEYLEDRDGGMFSDKFRELMDRLSSRARGGSTGKYKLDNII